MPDETDQWDPPLADPSDAAWSPRPLPTDTTRRAFFERCLGAERMLILRAELERQMNIDNFDAGPALEDLVREELAGILPRRYSVRAGVVTDAVGMTAGDCDVVVFNDVWFPAIKAGATPKSRRWHFPIEGVYAVLEVKQSLTHASLDEGMRKVVTASRLSRDPSPSRSAFVENRVASTEPEDTQLYTAVVAAGLGGGLTMDDAVHRFVAINGQLERPHVVNALCVLGEGFACWGFRDQDGLNAAQHSDADRNLALSPIYVRRPQSAAAPVSFFYEFATNLLGHLTGMTLHAHGIAVKYGARQGGATPTSPAWDLLPEG